MKKKFLSLVIAIFGLFLLAACGNKNSLDGKYYWINDLRNEYILEIKGEQGFLDSEGGHTFTIDKEQGVFHVEGFVNPTVKYEYQEDGKLIARLVGSGKDIYKEGSKAYKEALKKYGYDKKD